jgi:hypothetical protein
MTGYDLHTAITLRELGDIAANGRILMVAITSPLVGSLTIAGLANPAQQSGTTSAWVIPPSSVGVLTDALCIGYPFNWRYSSASDKGKATVVYHPS